MATVGVGRIVRGSSVTNLAPNTAAAGGDKFAAGSDVWLYVANAHATNPRTITAVCPGNVGGQEITDLAITVAAVSFAVRGPFPADLFGDANGLVSLTYSDSGADITFGAWKLGQ